MKMIIKMMGILDLLAAIVLILIPFDLVGWKIVVMLTMYLLFKAYMFSGNYVSLLDGISGVYMLLTFLGFNATLTPIFSLYLFQKAVFSF